MSRTSTS
ncbi:hypothetical protein F383_01916 [Gossypium arboreum]|nr:hypothetical protein F383_01916 [Gossypium arboreum]